MQAVQQTVNFVPATKKEWDALLTYIDANREAIAQCKTANYFADTNACANILSKHFKVNPPQRIVKVCPWQQLGVNDTIKTIARKYSVPAYMVTEDVQSALNY